MLKRIAIGVGIVVLSMPIIAAADTSVQTQLVSLYQQLVQILTQELAMLRAQPVQGNHASMTVSTTTGTAPLNIMVSVSGLAGDESLVYGDGHSAGSSGCAKNNQGFCDLTKSMTHTYQLPGTYTVTLYDKGQGLRQLQTQTITVTAPNLSQARGQ
jgi:hypothetical protein